MKSKEALTVSWSARDTEQLPFLQSPMEGRLVSTCMPSPGISVRSFLDHAEGQERFFWQNGQDQIILAGFGVAVEIMAWGEDRFADIRRKVAALFGNADLDFNQYRQAMPRLFGGFAFSDDFTPDNTWAMFHPTHFVLPHYQLIQNGTESWLTINAMIPVDEDPTAAREQLLEALSARYETLLLASDKKQVSEKTVDLVGIRYPMSYDTWVENIEEAVASIKSAGMDKVVLARVCELRSRQRIDVHQALDYLNQNYEECSRFLFEPRPYHAFYGATPEMLVRVQGRQLNTMALAGSVRRGATPTEDALLSRELMDSDKERHEHLLVVDSIRRRLQPVSVKIEAEETPEIYTLSYIHHLLTPIKAILQQDIGVLPLVEILHPTPALGGSPRQPALDFIRHSEPVPRGWYAGPIGWIDHELDGEFGVAIRSAVAQERRVWLYAGAGIVADSEASKEWAETELKFQPMFAALGIQAGQLDTVREAT